MEIREKLAWLRLIRSENVGPITFRRLMEQFGAAESALAALPDLARRGGSKAFFLCPAAEAERELAALEKAGGTLITQADPEYPSPLAAVEDAPPVLSVLGHAHLLKRQAIGMVGARNASLNGMKLARKLARDLGEAGLLVVSGMARGIDTAVHEGALSTGTVAVLAGGVDVVYPQENANLYDRIRDSGAVISEMPFGLSPIARHFPQRNRIVSGMSYGVVVVEAARRSGSLITARLAGEQGREVFAVPGSPLDPRAEGPNRLIRQGAVLTETAADVLEVLAPALRRPLSERKGGGFAAPPSLPPDEREVDKHRSTVTNSLSPSPVTVDEIVRQCQLSPSVVSMILLEMELAGRVERHPGNRVSLLG